MNATHDQNSFLAQDQVGEAPRHIWEDDGIQSVRNLEYVLKAEQHEIAQVAWQIWELEGRQEGPAVVEYWDRAEQQVLAAMREEINRPNGAAAHLQNAPPKVNGFHLKTVAVDVLLSELPQPRPAANGSETDAILPIEIPRGPRPRVSKDKEAGLPARRIILPRRTPSHAPALAAEVSC